MVGFNKAVSLVLCILISFSLFCSFCTASAEEEMIAISSKTDLNNIRSNLNGNYYLTCDIEFTEEDFSVDGEFYNSGKGFVPIGTGKTPFSGTFDGRGYIISGLDILVSGSVYSVSVTSLTESSSAVALASDGWTGDYIIDTKPKSTVSPAVGLFGSNTGAIKNLTLVDCNISASSTNSASLYIGGVVGLNKGTIEKCYANNILIGDSKSHIGGIAGYQSVGGSITDCMARGEISSVGSFGGIAGSVASGTVTTSYSYVSYSGTSAAAIGTVGTGITDDLDDVYYISDEDAEMGGIRISTENADDITAFEGFDFDDVWHLSRRYRLPALNGLRLPEGADVKPGDVNDDVTVDLSDVVTTAQYVAGWDVEILIDAANVNHDYNQDGSAKIDLSDVVYLAQYVAGWESVELY